MEMTGKHRLLLLGTALTGAALILLNTCRYGAGLSPDSVGYIAAARNLVAGKGLVTYTGAVLTEQPLLYPVFLATISRISGADSLSLAPIVNAFFFGVIVYLSAVLIFKHSNSIYFTIFGTAAVLISMPLTKVSVMAWSEPLFIYFVLLFIFYAELYLVEGKAAWLVLFSASAALACLTRYVGVTLILSGALIILLFLKDNIKIKFLHLLIFGFISAVPLGIWTVRNHIYTGTFFGPRASSKFSLLDNLRFTVNAIYSWIVPDKILEYGYTSMGITATAIAVFVAAIICFVRYASNENRLELKAALRLLGPPIIFTGIYTGFLIISSTTTAYDNINFRLLSPVYVPVVLIVLSFAQQLAESLKEHFPQKSINRLLAVIAVVVLLATLALITRSTVICLRQGAGEYHGKVWQNSSLIQYLRSRPLEKNRPVYSNDPDALYILANISSRMSPARTAYNSPAAQNVLSDLKTLWPEQSPAYLIWFDNCPREYLFTVGQLGTIADISQTERFADGAIYIVLKKPVD